MWRIYVAFLFLLLFAFAIVGQIVKVQFLEGEEWRKKAAELTLEYIPIEASRGNIFSDDGSMLATSIPIYDIRMDTRVDGLTKEIFNQQIDSLAYCLGQLFPDKSAQDFKRELKMAHAQQARYYLIRRNITYPQLQAVRKMPIFRMGRYKGGLLVEQKNIRELPFDKLAARTIGTIRDVKPVGIESSFNEELKGIPGKRLMQRLSGGVWMPVRDKDEIEPRHGHDVVTTIDINIQDVAEQSLEEHLRKHNADHGCAVLMEVATGEIKAIANLSKTASGDYAENFNYVIAEATDAGSTFKTASLLAALDQGLVDVNDTINVGNGQCYFAGQLMKDAHPPKVSRLSVREIFETSSNVGISRLIQQHYAKQPDVFIGKLHGFGLNDPLNLQIEGEGKPRIKRPKDKDWSAVSLPWITIGYEMKITPLQLLAFYNAIANNGIMVRPKFVKEIRQHGSVIKTFPTEVIRDSIAGEAALQKIRELMEGVVQHGTASSLKHSPYRIAGKTGTAQIAHNKYGFDKNHLTYQASFAGYFPADKPRYSCIVVVYAPSNGVFFGGAVAAPIFKEIADKVYSNHLELHEAPLEQDTTISTLPYVAVGMQKDVRKVLHALKVNADSNQADALWISPVSAEDKIVMRERDFKNGLVPNVQGMGARDAMYILENAGLRVKIIGKGLVRRQSLEAGSKIQKGTQVIIELG